MSGPEPQNPNRTIAPRDYGQTVRNVSFEDALEQARRERIPDEMVERAAEVLAHEFGYPLDENEECYDAAYWRGLARRALLAASLRTEGSS